MPYIKQERREALDPVLQKLWDALIEKKEYRPVLKSLDEVKGEVNYCFTKILLTMLRRFGTRYHNLSNIRAIPVDVASEFEAQFMRPYEDKKKAENGKVTPLRV